MEELDRALELTPNYRAAGTDEVKGEFLRYLGDDAREALLEFYNLVYAHQICPSQWRKDVAWPIHKAGDKRNPANYRLITLMSVMCKVFERIMHNRLTRWCNEQQQKPIDTNQVGFQANLCTLDLIYTLTETVRLRAAASRPTYVCFVDVRKAFPSVFKAGLLFKLHQIGVRGRYWRMIKSMYASISTRILTGSGDAELGAEELESLYYDVDTGVREGSILSPLLYILFIDGLLDRLRKKGLGVRLRNCATAATTWVGALMYADDLALLADGPGELQLMLDIITEYSRKWRFSINPQTSKTSVLSFMETKTQAAKRKAAFGDTWWCGGNRIFEEEHYKYLGVHITPDLNPTKHLSQLKYTVAAQKREAILIGVRAGVLPIHRAVFLWKQWVEPKYAYAAVLWLRGADRSHMGALNRIQCEGAEAILGLNHQRDDQVKPPRCALLNEARLLPAHALHAAGLMRFYRLLLSRPPTALLPRVWNCIQSHAERGSSPHWAHSVHTALHRLITSYPRLQLGPNSLPPPTDRIGWKHLTNDITRAETTEWTRSQILRGGLDGLPGRMNAYADIARELTAHSGVYGHFAEYLRMRDLDGSCRRVIAAMRLQCNSFVATHAQFRDSALYGPTGAPFRRRCCIWIHCTDSGPVDDAIHVFFECPHMAQHRAALLADVNALLAAIGFQLTDFGSRRRQLSFLLGSLVTPLLSINDDHPGVYAGVLRCTAAFLRALHTRRWRYRHRPNDGASAPGPPGLEP